MARILHVSEAEYHADPCERPSLNRTVALEIAASGNARRGRDIHPRFGGAFKKPTEDMENGSIMHAILLGQPDPRVIIDADDYKTKAAQVARDAARAAGKIPVKRDEAGFHEMAAARFLENIRKLGVDPGTWVTEVAIEWEDAGVLCRSRLDGVDVPHIWDLKFTHDASWDEMQRACINRGYDIQAYTSIKALSQLYPERAGHVTFTLLACEWESYEVVPYPIGTTLLMHGESRWARARESWRAGIDNDDWHGYQPLAIDAPGWALFREGIQV